MGHYQMTMAEMFDESFKPIRLHETIKGRTSFNCPICGWLVGIYSDGSVHKEIGWMYKREQCKNGHAVDWSDQNETI